MLRRSIGLIAVLTVLAVLASSCSGSDADGTAGTDPTDATGTADDPVDIEVTLFGGPAEVAGYQSLVDSFEAANPTLPALSAPAATTALMAATAPRSSATCGCSHIVSFVCRLR